MYELFHNKVNSNYFIVNIKLKFPESNDNQMIHINLNNNKNKDNILLNYSKIVNKSLTKYKNKYINIIRKWIQNILDKYALLYNSVLFVTNLNYDTVRVFLYFNPLSYSNMDQKHVIYLTDMINYDSLCKLNINDFIKLFEIDKLNLLIDLELDIIKPNLDSDGSSEELDSHNHTFDIIDYEDVDKHHITDLQLNKKQENVFLHHRYNIIKIVGVSGVNKLTFINEINKLATLEKGNVYQNQYHTNYDTELYVKIKENNKHIWVAYEKNTNIQNIIQLVNNSQ